MYRAKYNCITTIGEVLSFQKIGDRMRYLVQFEGKSFKSFYYSYELEHAKKNENNMSSSFKPKFRIGDYVKVKKGWFAGFLGKVVEVSNHQSDSGKRLLYIVNVTTPEGVKQGAYFSYNLEKAVKPLPKPQDENPKDKGTLFEDLTKQILNGFAIGEQVKLSETAKQWCNEHDPRRMYVSNPDAVFTIKSRELRNDKIAYYLNEVAVLPQYGTLYFLPEDLVKYSPDKKQDAEKRDKEYLDCRTPTEYRRRLAGNWKEICNRYLMEFCHKHDYRYEPDTWIGGDPGTIIEVCDMFVSMENIRYDVDNNIPDGVFEKWYWKQLELFELGVEHWMNFPSYCKGAPDEWPEERMQRLRDAHKRLEQAKATFRETITEVLGKSIVESLKTKK